MKGQSRQLTSHVATLEVRIDGNALPEKIQSALVDIEVRDDLEGPSACRLTFAASGDVNADIPLVDEALFDIGNSIEIRAECADRLETICKTEIVAIEYDHSSDELPRFLVRGYDRSHRLRRGTRQRTFVRMKDSDIASQIARENNLSAKVEDTAAGIEYVLQDNLSDYEFLQMRAAALDYEFWVDDKTLVFRAKRGETTVKLEVPADVTEFSAYLKAIDHVGAVEVRGWDPETKKPVIGTSDRAKAAPAGINGDAAFGKAKLVVVDQSITQPADADWAARAIFEKRARKSQGVEGSCMGRADLRAGVVIDVQGTAKRFAGTYRLTSVTHQLSGADGFRTSFSAEKVLS